MRDNVIRFKLRLKAAFAVVTAVAVGVMLMASGCARGAKGGNSKYVIVTLRGPSSMGMVHMMDSLGKASHNPFDIQIVSEPMQARKMMIDGTADFAVLPTTMGAAMYAKGLGYRLVAVPVWGSLYLFGNDGGSESAATLSQRNDGGSASSVSSGDRHSGKPQANAARGWIGSISDLRGRRIYVMAKGMTPDLLLRYLLKQNGIDPDKDVTLDYSFPTHIDLANAVAAGLAEIGVVSEPYVSMSVCMSEIQKASNAVVVRIFCADPFFYCGGVDDHRLDGGIEAGAVPSGKVVVDREILEDRYSVFVCVSVENKQSLQQFRLTAAKLVDRQGVKEFRTFDDKLRLIECAGHILHSQRLVRAIIILQIDVDTVFTSDGCVDHSK